MRSPRRQRWNKRCLLSVIISFFVLVATSSTLAFADASDDAEIAIVKKEIKKSALVGKLFPIVSKIFASPIKLSFRQILNAIIEVVDSREVAIFAAVGWGLVPITRSFYEVYVNVTGKQLGEESEVDEEDKSLVGDVVETKKKSKSRQAFERLTPWNDDAISATTIGKVLKRKIIVPKFRDSLLFQIVDHISQASRIGLTVIFVDCLTIIGKLMGHSHTILDSFSHIFSKIVYTGWITRRLQTLKTYMLRKTLSWRAQDMGKLNIIDHLLDGLLYSVWLLLLLDYLELQTGLALKSLFSLGATGTLVFGLASKDIASQIMSGLTLHLSEKMYEGDEVRFSDGTSGIIENMGWLETMIRNSDELVVGIPNSQLSGQRVYNLSRTPRSQVKQTLRISYDDADKIPELLSEIKEEIKKACPKLIADGSRAFRVQWQNYGDDHLDVMVDCHFTIKPTGDEYWNNRQKMLEAIHRAIKKTGVSFEKPLRVPCTSEQLT